MDIECGGVKFGMIVMKYFFYILDNNLFWEFAEWQTYSVWQ